MNGLKNTPNFEYEQTHWQKGQVVCGVDEVGRGSFSGPVFAGCVGFVSGMIIPTNIVVDDSKKLTQKKRKVAYIWLKENASFAGIGMASVDEINELGVGNASFVAMRRAVKNAEIISRTTIDHLLVDGFLIPSTKQFSSSNQTKIVKGDSISLSIASASIIAKVERDQFMIKLSDSYPEYEWFKNKGYGTKFHRGAILDYGVTKHHRKQFVKTSFEKSKLSN